MRIPYRELYFQSYPIGLFAYSGFAGVLSFLIPLIIFNNFGSIYPFIFTVLFFAVLIFNQKTRKDVCAYYGIYRKNKFSRWLQGGTSSIQNTYSSLLLMVLSLISYIVLVGPIIGAIYYFAVFPFDFFMLVLALVYILINLVPLAQIKKEFVKGYCEFPAKSN